MVWTFAHAGLEDDGFEIAGNNIWTMEWRRVPGGKARLPHPEDRTRYITYEVYTVTDEDGQVIEFATADLTAGVHAFYWWREL